jgi:hypothetical protein
MVTAASISDSVRSAGGAPILMPNPDMVEDGPLTMRLANGGREGIIEPPSGVGGIPPSGGGGGRVMVIRFASVSSCTIHAGSFSHMFVVAW